MRRLLFIFLFMSTPCLLAQERLTLSKAIDEARQNNPDLKAKKYSIGLAEADQKRFGSFFLSNPEFEYESRSDRRYANQGEGGQSFSLSQEVEILGQQFLRRSIWSDRVDRTDAEINAFENDFVAEVKTSFAQLFAAQEGVAIGNAIVELNRQLAEGAERRFNAGDISQLDYNLILVERDRSIADQYGVESQLKSARAEFNRLLGRNADSSTEAVLDTTQPFQEYTLQQLTTVALEQRSDLKAHQLEESATGTNTTLSWMNLIPTPKFSIVLEKETSAFDRSNFTGNPSVVNGIDRLDDTDKLLNFRIGVSVPIVIPFLFGSNQADIQQAQVENRIANEALVSKRNTIAAELYSAFNRYQSARQSIALYQGINPRLDVNVALLTKGYQGGQIDLSALLVQKDRIFRTRLAYVDALLEYTAARAELERAVGGKLP
ncbi:MAG: TolC family protein [Ignavibacteriae bacterium]|nr:TolC family protein [Ignavibacteriota bacterium]